MVLLEMDKQLIHEYEIWFISFYFLDDSFTNENDLWVSFIFVFSKSMG